MEKQRFFFPMRIPVERIDARSTATTAEKKNSLILQHAIGCDTVSAGQLFMSCALKSMLTTYVEIMGQFWFDILENSLVFSMIHAVHYLKRMHLSAMGGVETWQDALEFIY